MKLKGAALVRDYVERKKIRDDGTIYEYALVYFADGVSAFCEPGTINGESAMLEQGAYLRCNVVLEINQRGRDTSLNVRELEVLDTVEV